MKKNIILIGVIILLIPIVVLSFNYKAKYFLNDKKKIETKKEKIEKVVKLKDGDNIKNISLEEYIVGVVSCEMPASFNEEALKAQAVASRTYALKKMNDNNIYDLENSTNNQCFISKSKMQEKWGENYEKYYNKILNAVNDTKGEYLEYNGEIITAFYFAMSNGYTEESEYVFKENLPYITSVSSKWETSHKSFTNKINFTEKEFLKKLNLEENNIKSIKILSKTQTNRVNEIKINNKIFKGTEFRKLLGLKSTDFEITQNNNIITIQTKGYGHGVGMSQYGANGLAQENKTYEEILKYYYKNVDIKSV